MTRTQVTGLSSRVSRHTGCFKFAAVCAAGLFLVSCDRRHPQPNGNPIKQGQAQEVHLIWNQGQNAWKVKLNNGGEQDPKTATTLLAEGTGPTMFIVDIAGKPAGFKDPGGLTVWEGAKTQPEGSTQILGPVITKQGKMVFYDLNQGNAVKIHYSINLDNGESIDPIIDNRGGGNML